MTKKIFFLIALLTLIIALIVGLFFLYTNRFEIGLVPYKIVNTNDISDSNKYDSDIYRKDKENNFETRFDGEKCYIYLTDLKQKLYLNHSTNNESCGYPIREKDNILYQRIEYDKKLRNNVNFNEIYYFNVKNSYFSSLTKSNKPIRLYAISKNLNKFIIIGESVLIYDISSEKPVLEFESNIKKEIFTENKNKLLLRDYLSYPYSEINDFVIEEKFIMFTSKENGEPKFMIKFNKETQEIYYSVEDV